MPDTIIDTLEAIKLFLYTDNTAFVISADEQLIEYAVSKRFPKIEGIRDSVSRDYLEKLIQYPIRIPQLGSSGNRNLYQFAIYILYILKMDLMMFVKKFCKRKMNRYLVLFILSKIVKSLLKAQLILKI